MKVTVRYFAALREALGAEESVQLAGATTLSFAAATLALSNLEHAGGFARLDQSTPPPGASITLLTDDVAAALSTALDAGATPYTEPTQKPWGQTVAYVRDLDGILVELATPVA